MNNLHSCIIATERFWYALPMYLTYFRKLAISPTARLTGMDGEGTSPGCRKMGE